MEKDIIKTPHRSGSTLTINGKRYDAASGHAVEHAAAPVAKTRHYGSFDVTPAARIHAGPARSNALRRSGLTKPSIGGFQRHIRTVSPVPTHPAVSHFSRPAEASVNAEHVVSPSAVLSSLNNEADAVLPVGLATQLQNYTPAATVEPPKSRLSAKEAVISRQVANAPTHAQKAKAAKKSGASKDAASVTRRTRATRTFIVGGAVALIVVAAVLAYLTVPALSLFVAAKSAGVDATYPNYVPAGYHYNGPVSYRDGEVDTKFRANGSSATFTIVQRKSYWDPEAVLDNYVLPRSSTYLTYSQSGLTIYTFGSSAAWMNAGVLHTIDGNAPLTSDQILRIAGSM